MSLTTHLCSMAKVLKADFTLNDKSISYEEIFSDVGLLPSLAKRADQLCLMCLGYGIGVVFQNIDKSLLGTKVQFDEITPNVLRYICICDVLVEIIKTSSVNSKTPLDELMYD